MPDDPVLVTISAAAVAAVLTNLFKLAWPAAPSMALAAVALLAGIGSSVLVGLANGALLDTQAIASMIIQGILAAAGAAGLDRTSAAAAAKREEARPAT